MTGLGRFGKQLQFALFLPRGSHDSAQRAVWIERVLRGCWENGATFVGPTMNKHGMAVSSKGSTKRWEDEPAIAFTATGSTAYFRLEKEPLRKCISQMSTVRSSTIEIYGDRLWFYLSFDFAIDPQSSPEEAALLADPLKRYTVNPYVDRLKLTAGEPIGPGRLDDDSETGIHPYLSTYDEFWHWVAILCELSAPLFGLGYSEYDLTQRGLDEHDLFYRTGGQELLERRLPDIDALFTRPPTRYLAPDFPSNLVQQVVDAVSASSPPGTTKILSVVQRLKTNGTLARPGDPFFTKESESAFGALKQARKSLEKLRALIPQRGSGPSGKQAQQTTKEITPSLLVEGRELGQDARLYALEARALFQRVGEIRCAEIAQVTMNEVEQCEEILGIQNNS